MILNKIEFWAHLLEKLNQDNHLASIYDIFQELCSYLGFGVGFSYQINHEQQLILKEKYAVYVEHNVPDIIDLHSTFSTEELWEFTNSQRISFRGKKYSTQVEKILAGIFHANSMILIPILNQQTELMALIGIADRRGISRVADEDITFCYSILNTLANYMKLSMYQDRITSTQKALESIMDNMGVDIYVNDFHTHEILYVNRSMAAPYGGIKDMMGKVCWQVLYDDKTEPCDYCPQKKLIDMEGNPTKIYSWDYQRPFDGSWFRVLSAAFDWVDGRLAHVVSSVDITENKQNEEIIRRIASYDSLTNLPNRYKLSQDCDQMIPNLQSEAYMIFFDLDGFKGINDTFGHQAGDDLLAQIGKVLQDDPHTRDVSYRYGGDEFVVLCLGENSKKIWNMLDYLEKVFDMPFELEGTQVYCKASIGVSHYPIDDQKSSGLMRKADIAMYASKNEGKGLAYFYNQGQVCSVEEYRQKFHA